MSETHDNAFVIVKENIKSVAVYNFIGEISMNMEQHHGHSESKPGLSAYYPIFLITAYIVGVVTLNNYSLEGMNWHRWMSQFMAGFFLVFSAFKLLDIRGFADGYAMYDLLARRWHGYGYIYPFIELILGILFLTEWFPIVTEVATIIIMGFSSIGVINSLFRKQQFHCACLGTIIKVPLSSISLVEDLLMVAMALLMLIWRYVN